VFAAQPPQAFDPLKCKEMSGGRSWALVAAGAPVGAAATSDPTVKVTGGEIQGAPLPAGGAVFKGIPYAAPPVGALRSTTGCNVASMTFSFRK
jgi:hypothetical protein